MPATFSKDERLCSRRLIDRLYAEGHRFMAFPYSVQWLLVDDPGCRQVMIVAPKRRFHHAVDRNRVKRLTRECYRQRKHQLYAALDERRQGLVFSMVYTHSDILTYDQLGRKMDRLIANLIVVSGQ